MAPVNPDEHLAEEMRTDNEGKSLKGELNCNGLTSDYLAGFGAMTKATDLERVPKEIGTFQ